MLTTIEKIIFVLLALVSAGFFAHGVNDSVADEEANTGNALLANGKALTKLGAYLRERVNAGTSRYMLPSEVSEALI